MSGKSMRDKEFATSRCLYFVAALGSFACFAALALAQNNPVLAWGDATAAKLLHFLPQAGPELNDRMPWDRSTDHEPGKWAGVSGAGAPPLYLPLGVTRRWVFAEPALTQQVQEAKKQIDTEQKAILQRMQAFAPRLRELMREYQACNQRRIPKVQELIRQGRYAEAANVPECPQPKDPETEKLEVNRKELNERVRRLEARTRTLVIAIQGNESAEDLLGASAQQAGALNGHPLYRSSGESTAGSRVQLLVYLGPSAFRNPPSPTGVERPQVKCLLVRADINSRPETVQIDEAVARQMLQKVDYASLAKLLQP